MLGAEQYRSGKVFPGALVAVEEAVVAKQYCSAAFLVVVKHYYSALFVEVAAFVEAVEVVVVEGPKRCSETMFLEKVGPT